MLVLYFFVDNLSVVNILPFAYEVILSKYSLFTKSAFKFPAAAPVVEEAPAEEEEEEEEEEDEAAAEESALGGLGALFG